MRPSAAQLDSLESKLPAVTARRKAGHPHTALDQPWPAPVVPPPSLPSWACRSILEGEHTQLALKGS